MHHLPKAMQYRQAPWAIFGAIFTKLDAGENIPSQYLHAELHGCGFKNVTSWRHVLTCNVYDM